MNKKSVYYGAIVILIVVGIIGSFKIEKYENSKKSVQNESSSENKLDIEMEYSSSKKNSEQSVFNANSSKSGVSSEKEVKNLGPINVNTASYLDIRERGFSVNLAQRIIYFRELNGGISNWLQLDSMYGFGAKTIEKLQTKLTLKTVTTTPQKFSLNETNENLWYAMGLSRKEVKAILEYENQNGKITSLTTLETLLSSEKMIEIKNHIK